MNCKKLVTMLCVSLGILTFLSAQNYKQYKTGGKTKLYLDILFGYAIPINQSYIDTFENQDIYWNPNSGINIDLRLRYKFNEVVSLAFPIDAVIGIYQYKTYDGRKVNTEAQAGSRPITVNTEWSLSLNFSPTIILKPAPHPAVPYFGVGLGVGVLWSWESWDFTSHNNDKVLLMMVKYYWPSINVKAEMGWNIPLTGGLYFTIDCVFNLANYLMNKVELTNYFINNTDTIGEYNEKDRLYTYGFNVPDENKGGECLLAGFAYENYPQQKIATNASIKIGFTYNF